MQYLCVTSVFILGAALQTTVLPLCATCVCARACLICCRLFTVVLSVDLCVRICLVFNWALFCGRLLQSSHCKSNTVLIVPQIIFLRLLPCGVTAGLLSLAPSANLILAALKVVCVPRRTDSPLFAVWCCWLRPLCTGCTQGFMKYSVRHLAMKGADREAPSPSYHSTNPHS